MDAYLCFRCLKPGHGARDCRADVACKSCDRNHHTQMHDILNHYVPRRKTKAPLQGYAKHVQERDEAVNKAFAAFVQESNEDEAYVHQEEITTVMAWTTRAYELTL